MGIEDSNQVGAKTRTVDSRYLSDYGALAVKTSNTFALLPAHHSARFNLEQLPHLAGVEEPFAWDVRNEWHKWGSTPDAVHHLLASVGGMRSDAAVRLRDNLIGSEAIEAIDQIALGFTFKGLMDPAIVEWRQRKYLENPRAVLNSMDVHTDDARSWEIRSSIYTRLELPDLMDRKSRVSYLIGSITGSDSDLAWEIRTEFYEAFSKDVVESLQGLDNERADQMRNNFLAGRAFDKRPVLKSLVGTKSSASTEIYKGALVDGKIQELFVKQFGIALAGREDDWSWQLRMRYIEEMEICGWKKLDTACFLAQSIQGIDSEAAYDLRNKIVAMGERLDTEVISSLLK